MSRGKKKQSLAKKGFFHPGYAYLTCQIGPTRFEGECAVYIEGISGGRAVTIADLQEVTGVELPLATITQGEAIVRVVGLVKGGFLIDPPGQSLNSAGRIQVPAATVRFP